MLTSRTSVCPLYDMHVERGGAGCREGGRKVANHMLFEKGGKGANRQI